jgi:hypothetical protein
MDPSTISQNNTMENEVRVMVPRNDLDYYNDGSDKRDASSGSNDVDGPITNNTGGNGSSSVMVP